MQIVEMLQKYAGTERGWVLLKQKVNTGKDSMSIASGGHRSEILFPHLLGNHLGVLKHSVHKSSSELQVDFQ